MHALVPVLESVYGLIGASVADAGQGQGSTSRYVVTHLGQRFMAKHYGFTADPDYAWVKFECALLTHLKQKSLPVVRAVPALDGSLFTVLDGRALILFEWMDGGIEWPSTRAQAAKLGAALAEMHLSTNDFDPSDAPRIYDLDRLVERPFRLLAPFHPEKIDQLISVVAPLRSSIAAVPITPDTFGPIHGDLHQGNCHFTPDGKLSVFDFAVSGVGYRTYDLTGYLWPMRDHHIEDPAMRESCEGFLAGYQSVRPLTPEEVASISAFVQIRTLWETGDWVDTGTGKSQPQDVRNAIEYMIGHFGVIDKG